MEPHICYKESSDFLKFDHLITYFNFCFRKERLLNECLVAKRVKKVAQRGKRQRRKLNIVHVYIHVYRIKEYCQCDMHYLAILPSHNYINWQLKQKLHHDYATELFNLVSSL